MRRSLTALALLISTSAAAGPGFVPIQGVLTDSVGMAIDGAVDVTFTLYASGAGSQSIWTDTLTVDVVNGGFATELGGGVIPLDLTVFRNYPTVHLEVEVSGDSPMPLVPLDHVPYAAAALHAADADLLGGASLGEIRSEIPLTSDIESGARAVAYDTEGELTAVLDDNYLPATYAPAWADLTGIPAGFADQSDDGFTTEAELTALLNDNYKAAGSTVAWSEITALPSGFSDNQDDGFTTEAELTTLLDNNYLASSYQPTWGSITGMPSGFSDNIDDGFTSESQLTGLLDDNYLPANYVPGWGQLSGVPTGFADRVDDGFTTEAELTGLLNDNYLASNYQPSWGQLSGIPAELSDGDDVGDPTPDTIADDGVISDSEASNNLSISNGLLSAPSGGSVVSVDGRFERRATKIKDGVVSIQTTANYRYIAEATPNENGRVMALDHSLITELCKDDDGCRMEIQMLNYDGARPGIVASRAWHLYLGQGTDWWRVSDVDHQGRDGDGAANATTAWDCYVTDAETRTTNSNGRADNGPGFGLLNVQGGSYSDATTTCRAVFTD